MASRLSIGPSITEATRQVAKSAAIWRRSSGVSSGGRRPRWIRLRITEVVVGGASWRVPPPGSGPTK
jgi:hypothetical protein